MDSAEATVLITGATDGVGKLVATRIAANGARILLHGRSTEKGRTTVREIQSEASTSVLE